MNNATFENAAQEIAHVGRFLANQGWSPATSSNYSMKLTQNFAGETQASGNGNDMTIAITRTGVDKYEITTKDIIAIDGNGKVIYPANERSSAETLIHTTIYKLKPEAKAVLHTHSPFNTRLSLKYLREGGLHISGYEMQKGLHGIKSHEEKIFVPILPNAQDMTAFSKDVDALLTKHPHVHGFLIAGHGLYTWGSSLQETKRHVETYEFLFKCLVLELTGA